jgi:uroporphyrin-3 C-methyltransferase
MNDLPTLPEQTAAVPSAAIPPSPNAEPAGAAIDNGRTDVGESINDFMHRQLTVVVAVVFLLLAALAWSSYNRSQSLREELARSLRRSDATVAETSALARSVQEQNKELQTKVGVLESRQSEAQSQQLALEQLYQDLSKNRDEWALAEIEQVLSTASQQLQLAGNVQGALIALANADRTLSRSDKPQFITIRRAIAKDIDKLRGLPGLDLTGVAMRLDNAIGQVDTLPMLADEKPAAPAVAPVAPVVPAKPHARGAKPVVVVPEAPPLGARLQQVWQEWSNEMWTDVRQLIRVRSVDTPDALMLSPSQAYFLRENLKLRLLNARFALLARNETAFRNDLVSAQDELAKYFDTRAKPTQAVQASLHQVQGSNLAIEMPTLSDSLNAVRNYKAKP